MPVDMVSEQTILEELRQVPQDRWTDVQAYLRSLRGSGEATAAKRRRMTAADLLQSGLIGLWADRTDLGESRAFARRLREQAQTRRSGA